MSFFLEKFEWKSHFSRREREFFWSISWLETRTGILFYQSRVSRREREIENYFSRSSGKKLSWFSREFPGTGIPGTGNSRHSLIDGHLNFCVVAYSTQHIEEVVGCIWTSLFKLHYGEKLQGVTNSQVYSLYKLSSMKRRIHFTPQQ